MFSRRVSISAPLGLLPLPGCACRMLYEHELTSYGGCCYDWYLAAPCGPTEPGRPRFKRPWTSRNRQTLSRSDAAQRYIFVDSSFATSLVELPSLNLDTVQLDGRVAVLPGSVRPGASWERSRSSLRSMIRVSRELARATKAREKGDLNSQPSGSRMKAM